MSHPDEYDEFIRFARKHKIEVVVTNRKKNAYEFPTQEDLERGFSGGRVTINTESSIGAIRHELQHMRDAIDMGLDEMRKAMSDPKKLWELEKRGYQAEISAAREADDIASEQAIRDIMEQRRQEIWDEYNRPGKKKR